jgi:hypothetical protein
MSRFAGFGKDRLGGALLIVLGLAVVYVGFGYRMGSLTRMGAGYFPVVLGVLLAAVGALLVLGGRAATPAGPPMPGAVRHVEGVDWRAWLCILGGVAAFVGLGSHLGLIPATFAAVFVAALGDRGNSVRDAALLAALMVVAAAVIFGWALRLQLPLIGWE